MSPTTTLDVNLEQKYLNNLKIYKIRQIMQTYSCSSGQKDNKKYD